MRSLRNVIWCLTVVLATYALAQETDRIKVAEGEYIVSEEGDLGVGPPETEIFHLRESWTLWQTSGGSYEVEGERSFDSPRDTPHVNRFSIQLTHDFRVTEITEFAQLNFRRDSGPLTCDFLTNELRCSSGAIDPTNAVDLQFEIDRPYGLIWPISAFSLGSLVLEAGETKGKKVPVQVISLEGTQPSAARALCLCRWFYDLHWRKRYALHSFKSDLASPCVRT